MSSEKIHSGGRIVADTLKELLPELEKFYTDMHAHPELSMQETRTAGWRRIGCVPPAMT